MEAQKAATRFRGHDYEAAGVFGAGASGCGGRKPNGVALAGRCGPRMEAIEGAVRLVGAAGRRGGVQESMRLRDGRERRPNWAADRCPILCEGFKGTVATRARWQKPPPWRTLTASTLHHAEECVWRLKESKRVMEGGEGRGEWSH